MFILLKSMAFKTGKSIIKNMTRTTLTGNKIALLATGDEIVNGDILNTNAQAIAQKIFSSGMHVGFHLTVGDNTTNIAKAVQFLLQTHRILIITGGLGPTSDDLTRFALAEALNLPLVFDELTWDGICQRFKLLGYRDPPPQSNRQQAFFPKGAKIIPNPNGTAAGCEILYQDALIFMLPGPPFECLPMVDEWIMPALKKRIPQEISFYDHWLLFGVSEGLIAEQLDKIVTPYKCMTGYRLAYPYIEFKIFSQDKEDFHAVLPLLEKVVAPYLISDGKQAASTLLKNKLTTFSGTLAIRDSATGGLLESLIKSPQNYQHLNFLPDAVPSIEIKGLLEYWQNEPANTADLTIHFPNGTSVIKNIAYRGRENRVKLYAVEFICQQINRYLDHA
jgi:nicotinamide-nucleotide amidase